MWNHLANRAEIVRERNTRNDEIIRRRHTTQIGPSQIVLFNLKDKMKSYYKNSRWPSAGLTN
jgi:hypothetical protein